MNVLKRLFGLMGILVSAALFPVISIITIVGWGIDRYLDPFIYFMEKLSYGADVDKDKCYCKEGE